MNDFLIDVIEVAGGIVLGVFITLLLIATFSDMIFSLLGQIRDSWRDNMGG